MVDDSIAKPWIGQGVYNPTTGKYQLRKDTDDLDFWMKHAIDEINDTFGDTVRIKPKSLQKFGRTGSLTQDEETIIAILGAGETDETLSTTNDIDGLSCADDSFTGDVYSEGHTIDENGLLTFVSQTKAATGNTKATWDTPLARMTRLEVADGSFASPSAEANGIIYGYASDGVTLSGGVPQTASSIKCTIAANKNQSQKCATSFSNVDYGLITQIYGSASRASSTANLDFEFQVRRLGGVFKQKFEYTIRTASQSGFVIDIRPFLIVPINSDVKMTVTSSANSAFATAGFNALFGLVQS